jgi:S-phase kinase-associated protein 1
MSENRYFIIEDERISFEEMNVVNTIPLKLSYLIKNMLEKNGDLILRDISKEELSLVIIFCKHYNDDPYPRIEKPIKGINIQIIVGEWYSEFIAIDIKKVFDLLKISNYLDCKPLIDLCCVKIASLIKDRSPTDIKDIFKIQNIVNGSTSNESISDESTSDKSDLNKNISFEDLILITRSSQKKNDILLQSVKQKRKII